MTIVHSALFSLIGITVLYFPTTVLYFPLIGKIEHCGWKIEHCGFTCSAVWHLVSFDVYGFHTARVM